MPPQNLIALPQRVAAIVTCDLVRLPPGCSGSSPAAAPAPAAVQPLGRCRVCVMADSPGAVAQQVAAALRSVPGNTVLRLAHLHEYEVQEVRVVAEGAPPQPLPPGPAWPPGTRSLQLSATVRVTSNIPRLLSVQLSRLAASWVPRGSAYDTVLHRVVCECGECRRARRTRGDPPPTD
ncbi:hypothetical protein Agub_g7691, partial [Astrephomene gubernaculifera]